MSTWNNLTKNFDWRSLVRVAAPTLGTALGGPFGGMATTAIANAILGPDHNPATREADLQTALATATPETFLKLKQAEDDFAVQMKQLDVDVFKIDADDRASARHREETIRDKTPAYLAWMTVIGFFAILLALLYIDLKPGIHDVVLLMIGRLSGDVGTIYNYYYGSSSGSSDKNETIKDLAKK